MGPLYFNPLILPYSAELSIHSTTIRCVHIFIESLGMEIFRELEWNTVIVEKYSMLYFIRKVSQALFIP